MEQKVTNISSIFRKKNYKYFRNIVSIQQIKYYSNIVRLFPLVGTDILVTTEITDEQKIEENEQKIDDLMQQTEEMQDEIEELKIEVADLAGMYPLTYLNAISIQNNLCDFCINCYDI